MRFSIFFIKKFLFYTLFLLIYSTLSIKTASASPCKYEFGKKLSYKKFFAEFSKEVGKLSQTHKEIFANLSKEDKEMMMSWKTESQVSILGSQFTIPGSQFSIQKYNRMKQIIEEYGYITEDMKIKLDIEYPSQISLKDLEMMSQQEFEIIQQIALRALGYRILNLTTIDEAGLKITNENQNIKPEYKGMNGLVKLADENFSGDMKQAYLYVALILGEAHRIEKADEFGWKFFLGITDQYHSLITLFQETNFKELQNSTGQQMVANRIFGGDKEVTYKNVSHLEKILLSKEDDFKKLNWREAVVFLDRWKRENN